jgi:hypothetical protein
VGLERKQLSKRGFCPALIKGVGKMRTTYKEYGCTASITDKQDGTARLIVRNQYGQKVKDTIHKNRACALAAWRRMCD